MRTEEHWARVVSGIAVGCMATAAMDCGSTASSSAALSRGPSADGGAGADATSAGQGTGGDAEAGSQHVGGHDGGSGSQGSGMDATAKSSGDGASDASTGGSKIDMTPPKPVLGSCDALPAAGTWQEITPPGVATSDALVLDPFTIGTVWLGADATGGVQTGLGGLFNSTDCGATWTKADTGMNAASIDESRLWSLVIDPIQKGTIYTVGAYGAGGLWKSTNAGMDWTQKWPAGGTAANAVQGAWASNVSMDPNDDQHLTVGTHANCNPPYDPVCQAESMNGGDDWTIVTIPNPANGWVERSGTYTISSMSWLFTTEGNGIFLTQDNGSTWSNITPSGMIGASGGEFTTQPLQKSGMGYYYIPGKQQSGLIASKDGVNWSAVAGAPANLGEICVAIGGGKVFIGDFNSGYYYYASESDLTTWTQLPTPYPLSDNAQGPIFLAYDEMHNVLYSSDFTGGAWRIVVP